MANRIEAAAGIIFLWAATMAALALYADKADAAEVAEAAGVFAEIVAPVTESVSAVLIMADGEEIVAPMADVESCIEFTRTIGHHVESANCFTEYE